MCDLTNKKFYFLLSRSKLKMAFVEKICLNLSVFVLKVLYLSLYRLLSGMPADGTQHSLKKKPGSAACAKLNSVLWFF